MAEFSKVVITTKGQALMAKLIAGQATVQFTKIRTSSTQYAVADLEALTSLSNIKQTVDITRVTRTNDVAVQVEAAFSNTGLETGYYARALGLYAIDPDEGEILYAVSAETSGNCYFPADNGITVSGLLVKMVTVIGNATAVTMNIDPTVIATIGDIQALQEEISDLQAFVGYKDTDVFGVEVDFVNKRFTRLAGAAGKTPGAAFDGINAFGGRRRCNVTNAGKVVAYQGDDGFTNSGALAQQIVIADGPNAGTYTVGTVVQTMVEQPKFYYKVVPLDMDIITTGERSGHHLRKARYYVSDTPKAGFKLHPAFVENNKTNDFIYLSAFEGSIYDTSASAYILNDTVTADFTVSTGDKLSSIAAAKPASGISNNLTRANARKLAENRGSGWELSYAATIAASQLLMLIEYATFNMQSAIGSGAVSKTDDGASSMTELTGATVSLGNASGSVVNTNNVEIISYRGEENFWGNIWKWIDGMNAQFPNEDYSADNPIQNGHLYVADHSFADDSKSSPYEDTGITPSWKSGYASAFGYNQKFDWLFVASEVLGNSSLPVGDYHYAQQKSWRVALLGGDWDSGAAAGAFGWGLHSASSNRDRAVGGRLVFIPSKAA